MDQNNILTTSGSTEQYMEAIKKYNLASVAFIKEEKSWLAKQRKYLDSSDFKALIPRYYQEAAGYQYQMYEGDYLSSLYLNQAFNEEDPIKQKELSDKVLEETNKSSEAQDKYDAVWDREKGTFDWRFNFVRVPVSKCPPENNDIPVVPNPFAPPLPQPKIDSPLS